MDTIDYRKSIRWPFRQDDPAWSMEIMWDREMVIDIAQRFNHVSKQKAHDLLCSYPDGNTIGNEGCLLTCLAMVLTLMTKKLWYPNDLNRIAHKNWYYTRSGISMTPLYADLCCDVTEGKVQLIRKEEYLSGVPGRKKIYADTSLLLSMYRSLPAKERGEMIALIKIGTWDDTIASHYMLIDGERTGNVNNKDIAVLDPAMPLGRSGDWMMSEAVENLLEDERIRKEWEEKGIERMQIGGAWLFGKVDQ
jgi:hypothetical protein